MFDNYIFSVSISSLFVNYFFLFLDGLIAKKLEFDDEIPVKSRKSFKFYVHIPN